MRTQTPHCSTVDHRDHRDLYGSNAVPLTEGIETTFSTIDATSEVGED